jgi:hypothetical protein
MHVWLSDIKVLPVPLIEGKLIFLAKTFYLNKEKMTISIGSKHVFSIVHAHGVIYSLLYSAFSC